MNRIIASMLSTACVVSAARAEVVHFVNPAPGEPGHYDWHAPAWQPPSGGYFMFLDITTSPGSQTNEWNSSSIGQTNTGLVLTTRFVGGAAFAVVSADEPFVLALAKGDKLFDRAFVNEGLSSGYFQMPPGASFPTGERRYIGVQTADGHYGWIEVARTGASFAAFSWAYETVPGAPIAVGHVPAPGALSVLWLGIVSLLRRSKP